MSSEGAQIYIPNSCLYKRGLIIGYNISGFCIHVIDVQDEISAIQIEKTLKDASLEKFNSLCHSNLILLGIALPAGEPLPESCIERMENNNIWVNLEIQPASENYPFNLKDLYVCGYKYKARCQIIAYDDRSDRRLLTLNRSRLGEDLFELKRLEDFIQASPKVNGTLEEKLQSYFEQSDSVYERDYDLNTVEILKTKNIKEDPDFNRDTPNLIYIVKQINLCHVIRKAYRFALKYNPTQASLEKEEKKEKEEEIRGGSEGDENAALVTKTSEAWNSQEYKDLEKTNYYRQYLAMTHPVLRLITQIFIFFFQFQKLSFLLLATFINWKIPIVRKSLREYGLFTHVGGEITFKLKIMEKWPLWLKILNNSQQSSNYAFIFQVYSKLYSGLTFMITDTLLGLLFTLALYSNAQNILDIIHSLFQGLHISDLQEKAEWLMGEPSGFKPNVNFNQALGNIVILLLRIWDWYTTKITPFEGVLLKIFSIYGLGGMSFVLVIGKEVIRIYTFHVWCLYNALSRIYHYWLEIFSNFFGILSDKRINNITKKKEEYQFDWSQKIIAATIGISLISLLPTLILYYVWSLWIQIAVLLVHVILSKAVDFLNKFPLFLLISHLTDNEAIFPYSVAFLTPKKGKSSGVGNDYLELQPQKMPLGFILSSFGKKITKFQTKFQLNKLVSCIIKGISIFTTISYNNDLLQSDDKRLLNFTLRDLVNDLKTFRYL